MYLRTSAFCEVCVLCYSCLILFSSVRSNMFVCPIRFWVLHRQLLFVIAHFSFPTSEIMSFTFWSYKFFVSLTYNVFCVYRICLRNEERFSITGNTEEGNMNEQQSPLPLKVTLWTPSGVQWLSGVREPVESNYHHLYTPIFESPSYSGWMVSKKLCICY